MPATESTLLRQCFHDPDDSAERAADAGALLRLLLAQDGSATRLCEVVAGGPVALQLLAQRCTQDVPEVVRKALPGAAFLERVTCLVAHGQVMMDNLSYIALDGLDAGVRADLEAGRAPIGHLLARLWTRRQFLPAVPCLQHQLWAAVDGPADAPATRSYTVVTPQGPCMLITETFRRGMRMRSGRQ